MQANAYIPSHVFQEFNLNEDVMFKINLNILVECLCMFWSSINAQGNSVALQLFYKVINNLIIAVVLLFKSIHYLTINNRELAIRLPF